MVHCFRRSPVSGSVMVYQSLFDGDLASESFDRWVLGQRRSGGVMRPAPKSRVSISPFPAKTCSQAKRTQNSANLHEADLVLGSCWVEKKADRGVDEMLVW